MGNLMGHPPDYFRPDRVAKRKRSENGQADLIVAFVMALVVIVLVLAAIGLSQLGCNQATEGMKYEHRWTMFGGCQVQTPDGWIPLDNYYYKGGPGG